MRRVSSLCPNIHHVVMIRGGWTDSAYSCVFERALHIFSVVVFRTSFAVYHYVVVALKKILNVIVKIRMILLLLHQHKLHIPLSELMPWDWGSLDCSLSSYNDTVITASIFTSSTSVNLCWLHMSDTLGINLVCMGMVKSRLSEWKLKCQSVAPLWPPTCVPNSMNLQMDMACRLFQWDVEIFFKTDCNSVYLKTNISYI